MVLVGVGNHCSRTISWQIHLLITSTLDIFQKKRKSIKRDNKLLQIIPKITKEEKAKHSANFALDVVDRCTAEIN